LEVQLIVGVVGLQDGSDGARRAGAAAIDVDLNVPGMLLESTILHSRPDCSLQFLMATLLASFWLANPCAR